MQSQTNGSGKHWGAHNDERHNIWFCPIWIYGGFKRGAGGMPDNKVCQE